MRSTTGRAFRTALMTSAAAVAVAYAPIASAQQAQQAAALEEIVVTGSRIQANTAALNPVTVITAEKIQQQKAANLEDILLKDPAIDFASSGINQNTNNGGVGASQASIHSMGAARTLILLNGERFPLTDTQGSVAAVDLNNIPVSMIERIEVLRNGASSVYGADAVAGVINIITKKNFTGVQFDAEAGTPTQGGGGTVHSESLTSGISSDKGNVLLNLSYSHRDPIMQSSRGWATNQYLTGDGPFAISGRPPGWRITNAPAGSGILPYYGGIHDNLLIPGTFFFNLTQTPYLSGELDQKQLNFIGHYDVADNITVVADAFYTNRQSQELLNPEPIDYLTTTQKYPFGLTLPAHSPLNPTAVDLHARTRRFEGGPRVYTDDINTFRVHAGLDGTIFDDYDWHGGYVFGQSNATYRTKGEVNFTHFFQLAGIVPCAAADVTYGCHVADGLGGHGTLLGDNGLTQQEVNYFQFINTRTSGYKQEYLYFRLGGPVPFVPELPGGKVRFSIGAERRIEASFDNPDSVIVNGDGNSDAAPTKGSYRVVSGYGDLLVPFLKDMDFAKSLTAEASVRYDDYNIFGHATTWRVSGDYQPVEDIRFRGTYSTAIRAPQVKELFGGAFQNFATATDPCSNGGQAGVGDAAGNAGCSAALRAAGVANPAAFQSGQTQITTINGGNVNLKPEKAKTYTLGGVITPTFIPGFSFSADYYHVNIRNYIQAFGTQDIMEACYLRGVASACQNITRQAGTGEILQVLSSNINFGYQHTSGIDFESSYAFEVNKVGISRPGSLTFDLRVSRELHNRVSSSADVVDQVGTWQSPPAVIFEPKWRGELGVTYAEDTWSFNWTGRYIGPVTQLFGTPGDPGNDAGSVIYNDISATLHWRNYGFTVGVNNLGDRDPPFLNDAATNSLPNGYDYVGRFIFARVTARF